MEYRIGDVGTTGKQNVINRLFSNKLHITVDVKESGNVDEQFQHAYQELTNRGYIAANGEIVGAKLTNVDGQKSWEFFFEKNYQDHSSFSQRSGLPRFFEHAVKEGEGWASWGMGIIQSISK